MNINKMNPTLIEVKKEATERQIHLLKKMNPNSIILKEDSEILKELYYLINCGVDIRDIKFNNDDNKTYYDSESIPLIYNDSFISTYNSKANNGYGVAA